LFCFNLAQLFRKRKFSVAQWYSPCPAHAGPWFSLQHPKRRERDIHPEREREREGEREREKERERKRGALFTTQHCAGEGGRGSLDFPFIASNIVVHTVKLFAFSFIQYLFKQHCDMEGTMLWPGSSPEI
jgi:hypothetical protein